MRKKLILEIFEYGTIFILLGFIASGYSIEENKRVHQHITNDSQKVWILTHY